MEEKNKKNISFRIFASLLILLILFFSKRENQERFIELMNLDSLVLNEVDIVNSISVDENIDDIAYYKEHIIIWQGNRLIRYNKEGNKEWEKEFNFTSPYITFGNKGIYICDRSLGDIYYINSDGDTIGRFKVEGIINSIKEYSEYILVHVKEDSKEGIRILDYSGNLISKISTDEGSILNYCLNNEEDKYAYSILKLENERIKSEIKLYTLGDELNWNFQLEDEIIMYLTFVDERGLVAVSDGGLYYIDEGNVLWQKDITSVKDIHVGGEDIYFLYDKTYDIISLDGTVKDNMTISEEYNNFIFIDGYTIAYGEKNIMGIRGMKKIFNYESKEPIIKVIPANRNLIVMYDNRIDIVSFY